MKATEWAKGQTTETLKEWAEKMNRSNQAKANMSMAAREMMSAAKLELQNRK